MSRKSEYWKHKISLFLHDPVCKALDIKGHQLRASEIAEAIHQSVSAKDQYQNADMIASGITRAAVPGYSRDANSGHVDFKVNPKITHPLVANTALDISLPNELSIEEIQKELIKLLKDDIDELNRENSDSVWEETLFNYLFFAFSKRLRNNNIGGLGALWDVLPADTRIPDHSIWHHCGLTSAIGSSMKSDPDCNVSMTVFSITPVQAFIAKAKKLRDSWTASVILSYLSFIGIRTVMEECGPDHVMYPSLHDQSLVENWISKKFCLKDFLKENQILEALKEKSRSIASFPNKFVFLSATSEVEAISERIKKKIQEEWEHIARIVRDKLCSDEYFRGLFNYQISDYWQYSWVSSKLIGFNEESVLGEIIPKVKWEEESKTIHLFADVYRDTGNLTARLYGATHMLIQTLLASSKMIPVSIRKSQKGEKCILCGGHEVLHNFKESGKTSAKKYDEEIKKFWIEIREKYNRPDLTPQIGESERLCAVCSIKRLLPIIIGKDGFRHELLYDTFRDTGKFCSTTALAFHGYMKRLKEKVNITTQEEKELIQCLHNIEMADGDVENSEEMREIVNIAQKARISITKRDKYYAVLLMDGDKMGDLINGKTISASWADIIHPELRSRFDDPGYNESFPLKSIIKNTRSINPAVHSTISDSLNSFARYSVAPSINDAEGNLIYAGGDDVCAVLPLDKAIETAEKISRAYRLSYVTYENDGAKEIKTGLPGYCKINNHLGNAPKISISASLRIAHHKEPLREVLRDAHEVLEKIAKGKKGRNALAIRLKKRSGGDRDISFKWDEKNPFLDETMLDSFKYLMESVTNEETSTRLIYRLKELQYAIEPLIKSRENGKMNVDKIIKLFAYEVRHSGILNSNKENEDLIMRISSRLAALCIQGIPDEPDWFNPEGVIIGQFLAPRKELQ